MKKCQKSKEFFKKLSILKNFLKNCQKSKYFLKNYQVSEQSSPSPEFANFDPKTDPFDPFE